ncbi:MAG: mechanosensitive ion channel family protein [Clostridia bacterium]|nr:mechanosensitive ion channel family protein [Clostridia bacterium]
MEDFWNNIWTTAGTWLLTAGGKLLLGLVVLFVGLKLSKWVVKKLVGVRALNKNPDVKSFFKSALTIVVYALVIIIVITIWGVPTSSIIAVLGSCGLAIGLALQGSLSNLAGGLMILLFHPFHVGDYISNGTYEGTVEEIGVFYTTAVTFDNRKVVFPNSAISNSALVNLTANDLRRIDLVFEVDVIADQQEVVRVLSEASKACPLVLSEPAPFSALSEIRSGCAIYSQRSWCKTADYWDAYFMLQSATKAALNQNGIALSFPKTGVAVK